MKKRSCYRSFLYTSFVFLLMNFFNSCGPWSVSPELYGTWKSDVHKIVVRNKTERKQFKFYPDFASTILIINEDKTVEGNIGSAKIINGKIVPNFLLPSEMTLVAFKIKCELIGEIFEGDPLRKKRVEFWLGPEYKDTNWGLRYTTRGAQFPMAHIKFVKQDNKTQ